MDQVETIDAATTDQELAELVTAYGALARSLCTSCKIPAEHFPALCETLDVASQALRSANQHQACASYFQGQRKDAQEFVRAAELMAEHWRRLDGYITGEIVREFAAATKYALHGDQVVKFGNRTLRFEKQPLLRFPDMLQAIVTAGATATKLVHLPKGRREKNYPLKQLTFVLRAFWTQALKRRFTESFYADFPHEDDASKEEWLPKNDASRFIYEAVRALVDPMPDGGTCRDVMRQIIKASRSKERRTQIRRPKRPSSRLDSASRTRAIPPHRTLGGQYARHAISAAGIFARSSGANG